MSDIAHAQALTEEVARQQRAASREMASAYQAVFDGTPRREDQVMVLRDLEDFCGMRTRVLRATYHETGQAAGMLAVWQRIHAFRHPRRETETPQPSGERHGEAQPTPIGGVAARTVD